jgi:hypothetical protein
MGSTLGLRKTYILFDIFEKVALETLFGEVFREDGPITNEQELLA